MTHEQAQEDLSMTQDMKRLIDDMDYEFMLNRWRNAPCGDPLFQGEAGNYFAEAMRRKRNEVGSAEHVKASKRIGW